MNDLTTRGPELSRSLQWRLEKVDRTDDDDALLQMLADASATIAEDFRVAAAIIRKLESRGVDVIKEFPQFTILRKVAFGEVLPELYAKFCGQPSVLRKAIKLDLDDQAKLAADEPIETLDSNGHTKTVRPSEASGAEIKRAIWGGKIQKPPEKAYSQVRHRPPITPQQGVHSNIRVDKEQQALIWGGMTIGLQSLLFYINELTGFMDIDPREPCDGKPGSLKKLAILAERYKDGLPLWNDGDRGYDDKEWADSESVDETPDEE
jgi:hypothetical protein